MKLKEILKLICRINVNQPIKFYIYNRTGTEVKYVRSCKGAFNVEAACQDYEVVGLEAEQVDDSNWICITIENFDC